MTHNEWLRERLLTRAGVIKPPLAPSLEEIRKSQFCDEFEQLRSNRMVMGYFRYGAVKEQPKGKYNNIKSILQRAELYKLDKNKEHLLDIANICMVEWITGEGHFTPMDDGVHTETNK